MIHSRLEDTWKVMKEHRLELVDNTSTEYKCILCDKILINASVAPCGCRFCLDCIKEYLRDGNRKCPGQTQLCDVEDIDFDINIQTNQLINRKVSKLSIKCPNFGCRLRVQLGTICDHLRVCDHHKERCPYLMLGCDEEQLTKDQIGDHLSMEIHLHSNLLINWIRQSQKEMWSMRCEIDKLTEDNEKLISASERTKKFIQHLEKRGRENLSEIRNLNDEMCALKISNRTIKEKLKALKVKQQDRSIYRISQSSEKKAGHNQETDQMEVSRHSETVKVLQTSNLPTECDEIHHEKHNIYEDILLNRTLKTNVPSQSEKIQASNLPTEWDDIRDEKPNIYKDILLHGAFKTEFQNHTHKIEILKDLNSLTKFDRILNEDGNINLNLDVQIKLDQTIELLGSTLQIEEHNDEFTWNIDNLSEKVHKARTGRDKIIQCDSFFSHRNGYKICLSLQFDIYLWIYFHIMRGPFDNTLQWPFNRDVELSLINQRTGQAYKAKTIKSSSSTKNSRLYRPKSELNEWAYSFYSDLSPLEILRNKDVCQNDRMSIKFRSQPANNTK